MGNKNVINQTNRTILFEEINPEKMDILTLINDSKGLDSLDDENIIEINQHLLVGSFDEFLEKFDPKVYSYFDAESQSIRYILKKPEGIPEDLITEIKINNGNTFFKMLSTQEKKLHIFIRNTKNWMMKIRKNWNLEINLIQNLKKPLRITVMYLECCHLQ